MQPTTHRAMQHPAPVTPANKYRMFRSALQQHFGSAFPRVVDIALDDQLIARKNTRLLRLIQRLVRMVDGTIRIIIIRLHAYVDMTQWRFTVFESSELGI